MRRHTLFVVFLVALIGPATTYGDTGQDTAAARIRADARATGHAFKHIGKQIGHQSVTAYRESKGTFKTIGQSVRAQVPVVKQQLHKDNQQTAWIRDDYHRSISWIKQSARTSWSHAQQTWHQLTSGRHTDTSHP